MFTLIQCCEVVIKVLLSQFLWPIGSSALLVLFHMFCEVLFQCLFKEYHKLVVICFFVWLLQLVKHILDFFYQFLFRLNLNFIYALEPIFIFINWVVIEQWSNCSHDWFYLSVIILRDGFNLWQKTLFSFLIKVFDSFGRNLINMGSC